MINYIALVTALVAIFHKHSCAEICIFRIYSGAVGWNNNKCVRTCMCVNAKFQKLKNLELKEVFVLICTNWERETHFLNKLQYLFTLRGSIKHSRY